MILSIGGRLIAMAKMLKKQDRLSSYIEFEEDNPPKLGKVYDVIFRRDVCGTAKFSTLKPDGSPNWEIELWNIERGRC